MSRSCRAALTTVSRVGDAYRQQVTAGKEAAHLWAEETKGGMESLITARERGVRVLKDLANENLREVEEIQRRETDIVGRAADIKFDFEENKNHSLLGRQEEYAKRAQSLLLRHKRRWKRHRRRRARLPFTICSVGLKRQPNFHGVREAAARKALEEAEKALLAILDDEVTAEKTLQQHAKARADEAGRLAALEEDKARRMRELMKDILKEGNPFDAKGQPLPEKDRRQTRRKCRRTWTNSNHSHFPTAYR